MNTGSAFYIGKTHTVCQDFASHGMIPFPYVLISDGCSSSPDTDFGSRILVRVAENLLKRTEKFESDLILLGANETRHHLDLPQESLDATLLCAFVKDTIYHLHVCGDGVVVRLKRDGKLEASIIEYPSGAPFYLNYDSVSFHKRLYTEQFGIKRKITTCILDDVSDPSIVEDEQGTFYYESGSCQEYQALILLSDGISSCYEMLTTDTSRTKSPLDTKIVLRKLLEFKDFQKGFVERRFQKFHKDCERSDWFHGDDLSLGVIYLGN